MLKDAALLQLDLLLAALEHDMVLKDSTPYNVQFKGARPVFVDVGSFERHARGRAVDRLPPVLHALPLPAAAPVAEGRAVPPLAARARSTASRPAQMRALLSFRDRFRRGCSPTSSCTRGSRSATPTARRRSRTRSSAWASRRSSSSRTCARCASWSSGSTGTRRRASGPPTASATATRTTTRRRKDEFVRAGGHLAATGTSSGTSARTTAATRASPPRARRRWWPSTPTRARSSCSTATCASEGDEKILTLTMNLADPSPGLGWRGLERKAMPDRGKPDLVLALALVHHVAISANVPVKEFVDWLASLGSRARDRVPHARGPDGARSCSRPSATACTRTTSSASSSACLERGVRGRALRAPRVGHARALLRPPQGR